jgi:hypothetical protein
VDPSDDNYPEPEEQDYSKYEGYWHGFTFIIFDSDSPDDAWIRSTYWVPVAVEQDPPGDQEP